MVDNVLAILRRSTPSPNTFFVSPRCIGHRSIGRHFCASKLATIEFLDAHFARHSVFVSIFAVSKSKNLK